METNLNDGQNMLVPLDGSERAERALPLARRLARAMESQLLLLRVLPITAWPVGASPGLSVPLDPRTYQNLIDEETRTAREYLEQVAATLQADGLTARTSLMRGDPAAVILDAQQRERVGLIVMATQGRTGLARVALGSVADRVVRGEPAPQTRAPVLLVRAAGGDDRSPVRLDSALVPLDGSALGEAALETVIGLAGRVLRRITLVRVVRPEVPAGETTEARRYLDEVSARLAQRLVDHQVTVESAVLYGDPAAEIARSAEGEADLVIMATRARTGVERWAYGSVADGVLRDVRAPLLLVRPPWGD